MPQSEYDISSSDLWKKPYFLPKQRHFSSARKRAVPHSPTRHGKTIRIMTSAQDHKRAGDGDTGLNTGGMGTFSPSPFYTEEVDAFCRKYIYQATVDAMASEERPFQGIIFFGLMLTDKGPRVLEYNARFGDPEAQVVLPRMKNDIIDVIEACIDGTLDQITLQFEENAAVCVVLASEGYPVSYEKAVPYRRLPRVYDPVRKS